MNLSNLQDLHPRVDNSNTLSNNFHRSKYCNSREGSWSFKMVTQTVHVHDCVSQKIDRSSLLVEALKRPGILGILNDQVLP